MKETKGRANPQVVNEIPEEKTGRIRIMSRFIPATMMTQHPDSASRYVSVRDEPREAMDALTERPIGLGLEEIMVDYEGKLTPITRQPRSLWG